MPQTSMKKLRAELKALCSKDKAALLAAIHKSLGDRLHQPDAYTPGSAHWHIELAWRFFTCGLTGEAVTSEHVAFRVALFKLLTNKHQSNDDRRAGALELVLDHGELFGAGEGEGLPSLVLDADVEPGPLGLLRVINVLTTPYRRLSPQDFERPEVPEDVLTRQYKGLGKRWSRQGGSQRMIALPHGPMSTLTRESMNLGSLVRHGEKVRKNVAVVRSKDSKHVLVADHKLVMKPGDGNETYIGIPLSLPESGAGLEGGQDLIVALTQSLMQICATHVPKLEAVDENGQAVLDLDARNTKVAGIVEEIPRVVAGIFHAAKRDEKSPYVNSGEFVDSTSGERLTRIVGRSTNSWDSKTRVAAVRSLLERVELHRTVRSEDGLSMVTWKGPIIQQLADSIDYKRRLPDGTTFSKQTELKTWRIAPALWRMQDANGEAASFMLLDERAFELSVRSSDPFNLYWTIVQRAYNAWQAKTPTQKFDEDGVFRLKLSVLYTWSGVERPSDAAQKAKARSRMRGHLEIIRDKGLISSFDEKVLSEGNKVAVDSDRLLSIGLPPSLLQYLSHKAFRSGTNPYRTLRYLSAEETAAS